MVFLKRVATVPGSRPAVFQFLANFENAERWDPGTVSSARADGGAGPAGVGTEYNLVTVFKGSESNMVYKATDWKENVSVKLEGDGAKAYSVDEIFFVDGQQPNTTEVTYTAEIKIKGLLGLFAGPFLGGAFAELADDAINGIQTKCKEQFK